jgi:hypothetical protein
MVLFGRARAVFGLCMSGLADGRRVPGRATPVPSAAPILLYRTVSPAGGPSSRPPQAGGNLDQNLNHDNQDKEGEVQRDTADA